MQFSSRVLVSVLSVLAVATAGSAFAGELFTFSYDNLDGRYDSGSMLFTAADDANTFGNVSRSISPESRAFFFGTVGDGGFPGLASFSLQTSITNVTATTADLVAGSLQLQDFGGDVISAELSGAWTKIGDSAHFNGLLSNVWITSGNGLFDGTDGSSISLEFPVEPPFEGNIINLTFGAWFSDGDFEKMTTLTSGVVVPEPATFALFVVGGLALVVRRRRK